MSRRVVITGGGSGIGLALARRYIEEGAQVAICDSDMAVVKQVSKTLKWQFLFVLMCLTVIKWKVFIVGYLMSLGESM